MTALNSSHPPKRRSRSPRLETIKAVMEVLVSTFTIVGAIVAGGWALSEYYDRKQGDRVTRSLAYQEVYNGTAVFDARQRITNAWLANEEEFLSVLKEKSVDEISIYVLGVIDKNDLQTDIEVVTGFFDQLDVCIRRELCDQVTALELFGRVAEAFNNQHFPYLQLVRERRKDNTFARGLDRIALAQSRSGK